MRAISLTGMPDKSASQETKLDWCMRSLTLIAAASRQEGSTLADPYTITPPPALLRTLNAQTATLTQVAAVLTTFLTDMQKRGPTSK